MSIVIVSGSVSVVCACPSALLLRQVVLAPAARARALNPGIATPRHPVRIELESDVSGGKASKLESTNAPLSSFG
jgi:hypothetical protein